METNPEGENLLVYYPTASLLLSSRGILEALKKSYNVGGNVGNKHTPTEFLKITDCTPDQFFLSKLSLNWSDIIYETLAYIGLMTTIWEKLGLFFL